MTDLEGYLKMLTSIRRNPMDGYQYQCMEELVLCEGMYFKGNALSEIYERMPSGLCFSNAFELMLTDDLIYCEGYAISIIPLHHAWCIDRAGLIVDPTWEGPEKCEYYGIPFRRQFVQRTVLRNGYYGVIDDWKHDWPLCKQFDPNVKEVVKNGTVS